MLFFGQMFNVSETIRSTSRLQDTRRVWAQREQRWIVMRTGFLLPDHTPLVPSVVSSDTDPTVNATT